ncbi:MAG TPA: glycosyltransferase family 4 protein [Oligoflexia bacterium]|nr:glycosyltransferase family 4 protein [Oligoflexia bacterium]HMP48006.1 glycosyltransferase family 4 protein [Oligoflexia bacterium]
MQIDKPLKLYIASWAEGIGGGAARMESYYMRFFDRSTIIPVHVSLKSRNPESPCYAGLEDSIYAPKTEKFNFLVDLFSDADIVQFQGSFDPLVCEAAKAARVPLLIEVLHNIEQGGLFPEINASICVSKAVQSAQAESRIQEGLCPIIRNGIALEDFPFRNLTQEEQINSKSPLKILQVGAREKIKIHLDEISPIIFEKYPYAECIIAGRGQILNSNERISYMGVTNEIASLYRDADLMILLSGAEPFGLACIEAMASGAIPIVSNEGAFPEIIEHGVTGFLLNIEQVYQNPEILLNTIDCFTNSRINDMRIMARKSVELKFSARDCIRQYQDYYLHLYEDVSKKSLVKRSRLISKRTKTPPNALVGEALYSFQENDIESMMSILQNIVNYKDPITNSTCVEVIADLALFLFSIDKITLGHDLFLHLFNGETEREYVIERWLQSAALDIASSNSREMVTLRNLLIGTYYSDSEFVLRLAEILIRNNQPEDAIKLLELAQEKLRSLSETKLNEKNISPDTFYVSGDNVNSNDVLPDYEAWISRIKSELDKSDIRKT